MTTKPIDITRLQPKTRGGFEYEIWKVVDDQIWGRTKVIGDWTSMKWCLSGRWLESTPNQYDLLELPPQPKSIEDMSDYEVKSAVFKLVGSGFVEPILLMCKEWGCNITLHWCGLVEMSHSVIGNTCAGEKCSFGTDIKIGAEPSLEKAFLKMAQRLGKWPIKEER